MSSTKTIPAIASNEYEFNGVVKFCFSLTGRVRQFGPGRPPARAGAGSMSRSSGGCRHKLPVARLPALRKATKAGDRPSRWVGCANLAFACRAGFLSLAPSGVSRAVDIEVRDEMQRIALELP
jgi:hypothetical protein